MLRLYDSFMNWWYHVPTAVQYMSDDSVSEEEDRASTVIEYDSSVEEETGPSDRSRTEESQ